MKCAGFYFIYHFCRKIALQTCQHLSCGFVGKCKQKDRRRLHSRVQQVPYAPYYSGGLSCTRGGDDKVVPQGCCSSTELLFIERSKGQLFVTDNVVGVFIVNLFQVKLIFVCPVFYQICKCRKIVSRDIFITFYLKVIY